MAQQVILSESKLPDHFDAAQPVVQPGDSAEEDEMLESEVYESPAL